jgi:type II secretory pathway component PulM
MRARLEATWAGFNDREKKLVGLMMSVFAICVVVVPMYMLNRAIASLETENDAIVTVIDEIHAASPRLAAREAAARAAEARYNVQAPALASLVEAQSHEFQVTFNAVTNQPEVQQGSFRRRHVRASFPATGLRAVVKLMNSLEASQYPIGLERIHFDHFAPGEDRYNVELGVITYDRQGADPAAAAAAARPLPAGQAGPPTP